ncbi:hypothetical protein D3C72_2410950 [compost metagenome]
MVLHHKRIHPEQLNKLNQVVNQAHNIQLQLMCSPVALEQIRQQDIQAFFRFVAFTKLNGFKQTVL